MSRAGKLAQKLLEILSQDVDDVEDVSDTGKRGKNFEKVFIDALNLLGMRFEKNRYAGYAWDIKPDAGDPSWARLLPDKEVNIKVHSTKNMVGSAIFGKLLPWDDVPNGFDLEKAAAKVKREMNKLGWNRVRFLSPRGTDLEKKIIAAVDSKDVEALKELLTKKNFKIRTLGKGYEVQISTKGGKIGSILVTKGGNNFMRSERPRKVGGSSCYVAFKRETSVSTKTPVRKAGDIK